MSNHLSPNPTDFYSTQFEAIIEFCFMNESSSLSTNLISRNDTIGPVNGWPRNITTNKFQWKLFA